VENLADSFWRDCGRQQLWRSSRDCRHYRHPSDRSYRQKILAVAYSRTSSGHKLYRLLAVNLYTGKDTASPEIAATFPGSFPAVDTSAGMVHFSGRRKTTRRAAVG
jgi:hypothetical protein